MSIVQFLGAIATCALLAAWNVCACETVLTHAEISADRSRAVEFFGATAGGKFGWTISAAGDVNGDGFSDFVVAAPFERSNAGTVYVIFGRSAADWESAAFDFGSADTPDAASWILIKGVGSEELTYYGIARGDFNGDGLSDLLVSSDNEGRVFCIYGHRGNWSSFSTADVGSAVPGFVVTGISSMFVGNAGDMNGDGIEDMQFPWLTSSNVVHVVFGVPGATRSSFDTSTVDGSNGFSFADGTATLGVGGSFGPVGDINGDGLADLGIGSDYFNNHAGRAYILFARNVSATGQQWPASIDLLTHIDGTNGFIVDGPSSSVLGWVVMGTGDVNADGFDDVFIGSNSGSGGSWVVFGKSTPWASPFSASQLDGSDGFHFASSGESWGSSGDGAGDVNGDGINDVVIGGHNAANSLGTSSGAAVILFGRSGSWPAELSRNDAVGSAGFSIDGSSSGSLFGVSSSGVGDVNGDGLADFVVGAMNFNSNAGYAVLVFGVSKDHCAVCSNFTDACLDCDDGFVLNGTTCETEPLPVVVASSSSSSSDASSHQQGSGSSVVVIIKFNESISDPTELQEEIASVLGIDAGLVSVVVISPTEVEVTIIGSEETALILIEIISNGGTGSDGSGLGLLRKAIDARIRKDDDDGNGGSSGDDGVDAAPQHATMPLLATTVAVAALFF